MFEPFVKYAEFSGRASRREFWLFALLNAIVLVLIVMTAIVAAAISNGDPAPVGICVLAGFAWGFATLIPNLAVSIRRLHDIDKPGAFYLCTLIPVAGPIIMLICYLMPGTVGANRYGDDPNGPSGASLRAAGDQTWVDRGQDRLSRGAALRISGFDEQGHVIRASFRPDDADLRARGATIGRHPDCQMVISDATVSKAHARIMVQGGEIHLEDLQSQNGTLLNGKDIAPGVPQRLSPGDRLEIGNVELSVSSA
jgi:uncharacterized membrane protein YhaH (DUF805 family)